MSRRADRCCVDGTPTTNCQREGERERGWERQWRQRNDVNNDADAGNDEDKADNDDNEEDDGGEDGSGRRRPSSPPPWLPRTIHACRQSKDSLNRPAAQTRQFRRHSSCRLCQRRGHPVVYVACCLRHPHWCRRRHPRRATTAKRTDKATTRWG